MGYYQFVSEEVFMRAIKVYRNGFTLSTMGYKNHKPAKRGEVSGWSKSAARRNSNFLRSVDTSLLTGSGFGLTLTVRDCPPTAVEWQRLRATYVKALKRRCEPLGGFVRLHWVTEWQRRGVPHFHMAVFVADADLGNKMGDWRNYFCADWVRIAGVYGAKIGGQDCKPLYGVTGWLKYLAKHASRGVSNYQRSAANVPELWRGNTGRVWGKMGDWPTDDAIELQVDDKGYYQLRRWMRNYRYSLARARVWQETKGSYPEGKIKAGGWLLVTKKGVTHDAAMAVAKSSLRCNRRSLSNVRGQNGWLDIDLFLRLLPLVVDNGGRVSD